MTDLWYPNAVIMAAPTSLWNSFTGGKPKFVLHTTEGPHGVVQQSGGVYFGRTGTMPNATLAIVNGAWRICQHIPNNWGSNALVHSGPVQTNRASVVQVEIAWTSADIASLPDGAFQALAAYMKWDNEVRGTALVAPYAFAVAGQQHRMSYDEWTNFGGVCGHQHVPENDHTDPGPIDVAKLLRYAGSSNPTPTPTVEDDVNLPVVSSKDVGHPKAVKLVRELIDLVEPGRDTSTLPLLDKAIRDFQTFFKVSGGSDGIVGPATWKALLEIGTKQ